jgi:hypothetical protein
MIESAEPPIKKVRPECRNAIINSMESQKNMSDDDKKVVAELKEEQLRSLYQSMRVLM